MLKKYYSYVKDPLKSKYQLLINRNEKIRMKYKRNLKAFIDYSQWVDDFYNPTKKRNVLIVFDDKIADMDANKKLSPIVTELFTRGRETQYFTCFCVTILYQSS